MKYPIQPLVSSVLPREKGSKGTGLEVLDTDTMKGTVS